MRMARRDISKNKEHRQWAASLFYSRLSLATLRFADKNTDLLILLLASLGYGLVGFLDDYIKIIFKRSLGTYSEAKAFRSIIDFRHCLLFTCYARTQHGYYMCHSFRFTSMQVGCISR